MKQKENKSFTRRGSVVWALLMSYLLSLMLVLLAVLVILSSTLCSREYLKSCLRKSSYAETMYQLLCENYTSYGSATGFSSDIMTSFISVKQIEADMETSVDKMYEGYTELQQYPEIEQACYSALEDNAVARGNQVTEQLSSSLQIVADACRTDYANNVSIPLSGQFYALECKAYEFLLPGMFLVVLFGAVSCWLLIRFSGRAYLAFRYLTCSLLAAALLCGFVSWGVYPMLPLKDINLEPVSLRLLLLRYVHGMFEKFGLFAVSYLFLSIMLIVLISMAKQAAHRRLGSEPNGKNPKEVPSHGAK